jgi:translocation and assembly module TamA
MESGVTLERKVGKTIKWSAGPAFRWSRVEQFEEKDEFALIGLQSILDWDRSDNLLDPTRGGRLRVQLTPYWDTLGTSLTFTRGSVSYSHYLTLLEKPHIIFAARAGLGSLVGAERDAVPADLRFYAGGGSSIRGYPYQTVGPLVDDDPIGGRSLFEVNTELRVRVTRDIGIVGFIDGGSAFEDIAPDFSEDILWGAGLGFRYYTPIGPLRLDVAVPLQRRHGIDDWFQVYVSIGQAF